MYGTAMMDMWGVTPGSSSSIFDGPVFTGVRQQIGIFETALSIGSSSLGNGLGGWAGTATALVFDNATGVNVLNSVRDFVTYTPYTRSGQQALLGTAPFLQPTGDLFQGWQQSSGDFGYELFGNNALAGSMFSLAPDLIAEVISGGTLAALPMLARSARSLDDIATNGTRTSNLVEDLNFYRDEDISSRMNWTPDVRKGLSPYENSVTHWDKHVDEFPQLSSFNSYVDESYNFLLKPSETTQSFTRVNGDIMRYDTATNTFGVLRVDGTPRTMFKPKDELQYWLKQLKQYGGE